MEMRAARVSAPPYSADHPSALHFRAAPSPDAFEVRVSRLPTAAVVEENSPAVRARAPGKYHRAVGSGLDGCAGWRGKVDTLVVRRSAGRSKTGGNRHLLAGYGVARGYVRGLRVPSCRRASQIPGEQQNREENSMGGACADRHL